MDLGSREADVQRTKFNEELREIVARGEQPGEEYQQILAGVFDTTAKRMAAEVNPEYRKKMEKAGLYIVYQLLYGIYWEVLINEDLKIKCNYRHDASWLKIMDEIYSVFCIWDEDSKFVFTGVDKTTPSGVPTSCIYY